MAAKRFWTEEGEYVGPGPKRGGFGSGSPGMMFSFESQREQYPELGEPGISYVQGKVEAGVVDVLLHRDSEGRIDGILFHYPQDIPPYEVKGGCNIFVDPTRLRQGIATALVREAGPRFNLKLTGQRFTPEGAALATSLLKRGRTKV